MTFATRQQMLGGGGGEGGGVCRKAKLGSAPWWESWFWVRKLQVVSGANKS